MVLEIVKRMYLSSVPEDPLNVFPASKYILTPLSDLLYGNLEESLGKVVSDRLYQISGLLIRNEVCDAASRLYEEGSPRKEGAINRLMSESVRDIAKDADDEVIRSVEDEVTLLKGASYHSLFEYFCQSPINAIRGHFFTSTAPYTVTYSKSSLSQLFSTSILIPDPEMPLPVTAFDDPSVVMTRLRMDFEVLFHRITWEVFVRKPNGRVYRVKQKQGSARDELKEGELVAAENLGIGEPAWEAM